MAVSQVPIGIILESSCGSSVIITLYWHMQGKPPWKWQKENQFLLCYL